MTTCCHARPRIIARPSIHRTAAGIRGNTDAIGPRPGHRSRREEAAAASAAEAHHARRAVARIVGSRRRECERERGSGCQYECQRKGAREAVADARGYGIADERRHRCRRRSGGAARWLDRWRRSRGSRADDRRPERRLARARRAQRGAFRTRAARGLIHPQAPPATSWPYPARLALRGSADDPRMPMNPSQYAIAAPPRLRARACNPTRRRGVPRFVSNSRLYAARRRGADRARQHRIDVRDRRARVGSQDGRGLNGLSLDDHPSVRGGSMSTFGTAATTRTLQAILLFSVTADPDLNDTTVTTLPLTGARNSNNNQLNLFLSAHAQRRWSNRDIPQQVKPGETTCRRRTVSCPRHRVRRDAVISVPFGHELLGKAMSTLHDHAVLSADDIRNATAATRAAQRSDRRWSASGSRLCRCRRKRLPGDRPRRSIGCRRLARRSR